jgi:hypothetical protein
LAALLAIALFAATAPAAFGFERILRAELSPMAPASEVRSLQDQADAWLPAFYQAFPEALRSEVTMVSIERSPRGIGVRLELEGSADDSARATRLAAAELKQLLAGAHLRFAYRLSGNGLDQPGINPPPAAVRAIALSGLAVLAVLGAVVVLVRRRTMLALPQMQGIPVLGILPAGIGMGGRFFELQSPPAQALGVFFRRLATRKRPMIREAAVIAFDDPDVSAVATACLAIALLRERGRVLVVDLAGDESILPIILEETDDAGDLPGKGTLRSTSIADLDLLTGLVPVENQRPPLPSELLGRYRWVLYHAPAGSPVIRTRHVLVLQGPVTPRRLYKARWRLLLRRSPLLGLVLLGVPVPARMRDGLMARFYFEKLQAQEVAS